MTPVNPGPQITELLQMHRSGDNHALETLFPIVYEELHRIASSMMRGERGNHTLQPTALVNEAYLRLIGNTTSEYENKQHFIAISARVMRQVLVDHARAKKAEKRGGDFIKVTLSTRNSAEDYDLTEILAIDSALDKLSQLSERQARVVELRYFSGLEIEEVAQVLGISAGTVKRDWTVAKAWLFRELSDSFPIK